jgi:hypothetical protein
LAVVELNIGSLQMKYIEDHIDYPRDIFDDISDIIHWAIQGRVYYLMQEDGTKDFFSYCDRAARDVLERTKKMGITE